MFIDKRKLALKLKSGEIIEIELAWPGSSAEMILNRQLACTTIKLGEDDFPVKVADLDMLLALKLSHRYKKDSPHFLKTMEDIHLLRAAGATTSGLEEFMKLRELETYGYKHPNLKRTKKQFFADDAIQYVYDHDSIHETIAWLEKPAYRFFSIDGQEVLSSKEKFYALPELVRMLAVVEESTVLALERSQIPFRGKVDPKKSFDIALMKVCTSITSGWFREYAWEHYHEAQKMYDDSYVDLFWNAVDAGQVRPFTK
jgi:hypothetical protein